MGYVEIHTVEGWVSLDDALAGKEKCAECGEVATALGAGYVSTVPVLYYCQSCLERHK